MSTRIEREARWSAFTETEKRANQMPDYVRGVWDEAVGEVISGNDDIEWTSGGGAGGFIGLSDRLEGLVGPTLPECDREDGCQMTLDVCADAGPERAVLTFTCPSSGFRYKKDADACERVCEANQAAAFGAVVEWAEGTSVQISSAREEIERAEGVIRDQKAKIRNLV